MDRFTKDEWWQAESKKLDAWNYDTYARVLTIVKPQPRNWFLLRYQGSWVDSLYKNSDVFTPYIIVEAASSTDARCRLASVAVDCGVSVDWFSEMDSWQVDDEPNSEWEACFVNIKNNLSYPYIVTLFHANDMVQHVKMEE